MTAPGSLGYNPFEPATISDPYPVYRHLLEGPPLIPALIPNVWVASRWVDVRRVLVDRSFSADRRRASLAEMFTASTGDETLDRELEMFNRLLLTTDPPDHTRMRRLVSHAFTARRVEALSESIEQIAVELAGEMRMRGDGSDLIGSFAYPFPVRVIASLLGLPEADRESLKRWSDDVALLLDPFPGMDALHRFGESITEFRTYLDEHFEMRRRREGDDLIGALVSARDGEDALSDDEMFALVVLLVAAGHETTTNLIGNSVMALTRHPEERRRLVADPGLLPGAVEELLRFDSPVQRTSRVATETTELGDVDVTEGDLVILVLGAANRDPSVFADPERLDVTRGNASSHVSFGHGIHFCLGAPLARWEGRIGLSVLYSMFPELEADLTGLRWKPSLVLRGVEELPVAFNR